MPTVLFTAKYLKKLLTSNINSKSLGGLSGDNVEYVDINLQTTTIFCEFHNNELFVINSNIEEYHFGNQFNHKAKSERKLLLNKRELRKLEEVD